MLFLRDGSIRATALQETEHLSSGQERYTSMLPAVSFRTPSVANMWFPVSTVAALCIILDATDATVSNDHELEEFFRQRSKSEWEEAWHREKYTRCRETLLQHLYWACEKDIYRLTRRSQPTNKIKSHDDTTGYNLDYPWISHQQALQLLRDRRGGSSITAECCSASGCTWEEYAEYCPTNKRHSVVVQ